MGTNSEMRLWTFRVLQLHQQQIIFFFFCRRSPNGFCRRISSPVIFLCSDLTIIFEPAGNRKYSLLKLICNNIFGSCGAQFLRGYLCVGPLWNDGLMYTIFARTYTIYEGFTLCPSNFDHSLSMPSFTSINRNCQ